MAYASYTEFKTAVVEQIISCGSYNKKHYSVMSHIETTFNGATADVVYLDEWHDNFEGHAQIRVMCEDEMVKDLIIFNLREKYNTIFQQISNEPLVEDNNHMDIDALKKLIEEKGGNQ